jgi:hypothetical protein
MLSYAVALTVLNSKCHLLLLLDALSLTLHFAGYRVKVFISRQERSCSYFFLGLADLSDTGVGEIYVACIRFIVNSETLIIGIIFCINENTFLSLLLTNTVWETTRPISNLGPT